VKFAPLTANVKTGRSTIAELGARLVTVDSPRSQNRRARLPTLRNLLARASTVTLAFLRRDHMVAPMVAVIVSGHDVVGLRGLIEIHDRVLREVRSCSAVSVNQLRPQERRAGLILVRVTGSA